MKCSLLLIFVIVVVQRGEASRKKQPTSHDGRINRHDSPHTDRHQKQQYDSENRRRDDFPSRDNNKHKGGSDTWDDNGRHFIANEARQWEHRNHKDGNNAHFSSHKHGKIAHNNSNLFDNKSHKHFNHHNTSHGAHPRNQTHRHNHRNHEGHRHSWNTSNHDHVRWNSTKDHFNISNVHNVSRDISDHYNPSLPNIKFNKTDYTRPNQNLNNSVNVSSNLSYWSGDHKFNKTDYSRPNSSIWSNPNLNNTVNGTNLSSNVSYWSGVRPVGNHSVANGPFPTNENYYGSGSIQNPYSNSGNAQNIGWNVNDQRNVGHFEPSPFQNPNGFPPQANPGYQEEWRSNWGGSSDTKKDKTVKYIGKAGEIVGAVAAEVGKQIVANKIREYISATRAANAGRNVTRTPAISNYSEATTDVYTMESTETSSVSENTEWTTLVWSTVRVNSTTPGNITVPSNETKHY